MNYKKYKTLSQEELNNELSSVCMDGDLEKVKYLLTSPDLKIHADLSYKDYNAFILATITGNLDIVKYLLTSPDLKIHANIHAQNDEALRTACINGKKDFEIIKYLLISPDLKEHANMHAKNDTPLINACGWASKEVIQFLLTSPDLKGKLDIHVNEDAPIKSALIHGNIEVIKYLINSKELSENVNPEILTEKELINFMQTYFMDTPEDAVFIEYAMYELNIKIKPETLIAIKKDKFNGRFLNNQKFLKIVESKDLYFKLNRELNPSNNSKKAKI